MSSWLCFICHNIVSLETNDEVRDKYRELIGMNLSSESYLCRVCTHMLEKFWFFKSVCLKRSLEYPVLYSEEGTLNLQTSEVEINTLCVENTCTEHKNNKSIHFVDKNDDFDNDYDIYNDLPDAKNDFDGINETLKPNFDTELKENRNNDDQIIENQNYDEKLVFNDQHQNGDNSDENNEFNEETNNDINNDDTFNDEHHYTDQINENVVIENNDNEIYSDHADQNNINKVKKKRNGKKRRKKKFVKVILSLEEQKTELERNRREKKYIEAEFKCYNCALAFLFKDTYQAHMMRHEESNGEFRCDTCTLRFATPAVLRAHAALHAERFVCRRCHVTLRPRARPSHAAQCFGKPGDVAACDKCPRLFKDSSGLQQHLKRFHQTKASTRTYSCSVCGKSYCNQAAVRTHMIKHIHRKFTCSVCSVTFSSPYTLTQHKRKHDTPQEAQYCVPCDKTFKNRKSLLAHRKNAKHHQEDNFECPICARACANQRSLTHHIDSVHSATKNYACPRCNARYATEKALRTHLRRHDVTTEAKTAVCHLCGRGFKGNSKLNRHLREVCEKQKLEEELSSYYAQQDVQ